MEFILLTLCWIFFNDCFADNQVADKLFTIDSIHDVRLYFNQPHYWDTLVNRYDKNHDVDSAVIRPLLGKIKIDGIVVDSIGVKLKSNFSHTIPTEKKPIKIDFNAFVKGKNYEGLQSLNLSNEFPDPSMLRNTVAYKIFRDAGIRAPRTSFARVYINEEYKGLYVIIEQIDKVFISHNFPHSGGDLIKAVASSLFWLPDDTMSFRKNYEIKSRSSQQAITNLIAFAKKINTTTAEVFFDSLKNDFDFDSYLPVLAADIIFNNWDSYFYGQNYYLYRDSSEKKYFYLPWDYNVSMNNYELSGGDFDILPGGDDNAFFQLPLPVKMVYNVKLKQKYLDEICRINLLMSSDTMEKFIYKLHDLLKSSLKSDSNKVFSMDQYEKSLSQKITISEIGFEGLLTFIHYREKQVQSMLKNAGHNCDGKHNK